MGKASTSPIWFCTECRTPHPQPSPPTTCSACHQRVSFAQQPLGWRETASLAEDHTEHPGEPEQVIDAVTAPIVSESGKAHQRNLNSPMVPILLKSFLGSHAGAFFR